MVGMTAEQLKALPSLLLPAQIEEEKIDDILYQQLQV